MSFEPRFQLGAKIPESVGSSDFLLPGKQISTGRPVTIHLLAGGNSPENGAVLEAIAALPQNYRVCFLETGEFRGNPYVITDVVAGNPPLREWLDTLKKQLAKTSTAKLRHVGAWKIPVYVR